MLVIDTGRLAERLSARLGLELLGCEVEIDGGRFRGVRPASPEEPHGFSVLLVRAPRAVIATLQLDRFAGPLMRSMAESDVASRTEFTAQVARSEADGVGVSIMLDGLPAGTNDVSATSWRRIDLECTRRIESSAESEAAVTVAAGACLSCLLTLLPLAEVSEDMDVGLPEGARYTVVVNRYERSPVNRAACLAHYGTRCAACGFEFEDAYGRLGEGYAEVHHIVPVSQMCGAYRVDPVRDLVPLCANCHAMVHRRTPPLAVTALRDILEKLRG